MERQPNTENRLYLKLMEEAQERNRLNLINMVSFKDCYVIKTEKPEHLRKRANWIHKTNLFKSIAINALNFKIIYERDCCDL